MLWGPRAEAREVEAAKAAAPFLQPVAQMLTMGASLLEPALKPFLDDLVSVLLGRECAKVEPLELKGVGAISVEMFPLVPLMLYRYRDPFDGAVDLELIQRFTSRAARGSLIVIEELENFKHPTLLIDLVREVARKAVERDLTLVATTAAPTSNFRTLRRPTSPRPKSLAPLPAPPSCNASRPKSLLDSRRHSHVWAS
jgi:hypothetical protein